MSQTTKAEQASLQPPDDHTDVAAVIRGVEADAQAVSHHNRIIEASEGFGWVTMEIVTVRAAPISPLAKVPLEAPQLPLLVGEDLSDQSAIPAAITAPASSPVEIRRSRIGVSHAGRRAAR